MFQFTTTNVINTNLDYTTGLPLWSTQIEGLTDEKGHKYKVSALNIKRHLNFKKPNVVGITKAEYTEPKNGKVTLDLSTLNASTEGGTFRIAMYIRLAMNSQNSYYSNDLVFKGKPIYIEFIWKKNQTPDKVAEQIKKNVKKYFLVVYEKPIVKVTNEGSKVIIECTDEYQRFTKVDIEKYTPYDVKQNTSLGVNYLRELHQTFSDTNKLGNNATTSAAIDGDSLEKFAVAAFNAGKGRVASAQEKAYKAGLDPRIFENVYEYLPDITKNYVKKVMAAREEFSKNI